MVEGEKENQTVVKPEDKKSNSEKTLRTVAIFFGIFAIISVIFYAIKNPDFKIWVLISIVVGVVIVIWILYNFFKLQKKAKDLLEGKPEEDKIPEPASREIITKRLYTSLKNPEYMNEVRNVLDTRVYNIGGNLLYCFEVETLYKDTGKSPNLFIIINANFPDRLPTILKDPSKYDLNKILNSMSSKPQFSDIEKTETFFPQSGAYVKSEKNKPQTKKENKNREEME